MQLKNSYMYYISAIKPEMCKKIISHGLSKMVVDESKGVSKIASTFDGKEKGGTDAKGNKVSSTMMSGGATRETLAKRGIDSEKTYVRDSEISWLNDKWIYDIFHPYIHHANQQAGWNWKWDFSESFQFTVYHGRKQNGGFYGWHADGSSDFKSIYRAAIKVKEGNEKKGIAPTFKPPKRDEKGFVVMRADGKPEPDMRAADIPLKRDKKSLAPGFTDNVAMWDKVRKISMTVNLTDPKNYAGGNLKFDLGAHAGNKRFKVCEEIRPMGSIIIFPSFTYHCVTPVTRGTRYSLVLWSLGKPWQ
jgi:hypothetical protein